MNASQLDLSQILREMDSESPQEAFTEAATRGRVDLLQALLPHVNAGHGNSEALAHAAEAGHMAAVQFLLPLSFAPMSQALLWAALQKQDAIMRVLLPHYNRKDLYAPILDAITRHFLPTQTIIICNKDNQLYREALEKASAHGQHELLESLWQQADVRAAALADSDFLERAFIQAGQNNHRTAIEFWVKHQAELPHIDWEQRLFDSLRTASLHGHSDLVDYLLPLTRHPGAMESWAFRAAARQGHLKIVQTLLPYSEPRAEQSQALIRAIEAGHTDVALFLVPHSDLAVRDFYPLQCALKHNLTPLVRELLPFSDAMAVGQALAAKEKWRELDLLASEASSELQQSLLQIGSHVDMPKTRAKIRESHMKTLTSASTVAGRRNHIRS